MSENKSNYEVSVVQSLVENVRRQEKEIKELRSQLEEARDEKELKELRGRLEAAAKSQEELIELKKQLELASLKDKESQKAKDQQEQQTQDRLGRQEKELRDLKALLDEANQQQKALKVQEKELREEKKQIDKARDEDLDQARGVLPQLEEVAAMVRDARKDAAGGKVDSDASSEFLAITAIGATETVEQLGAALGRIEEKLQEIMKSLAPKGKKSRSSS